MGRHYSTQLRGVSHENDDGSARRDILRKCSIGEEVELIPEPENLFDANAVKVCRSNGEQLGYLPARSQLAKKLEQGCTFRARIKNIRTFHRKGDERMSAELDIEVLSGGGAQADADTTTGCLTCLVMILILMVLISLIGLFH